MPNEEVLGPRKTMFILVIVMGCFAVLWPRILSPLLFGYSQDHLKPNQYDRDAGCCDIIFESEVAVLEIINEVCNSVVPGDVKLSPYAAAECRKSVNETCGVDIAHFLKRSSNVGKTTKMFLDTMKSSNSSCMKEHFGVPIWSMNSHHLSNSWTLPDTLKQERPAIRGVGPHPALRERGRAIPAGVPTPTSRGPVSMPPHVRVRSSPLSGYFDLDIKPPPIPGMRPPLGSPGGPVPAPKSSMGFVMPIYTICIIIFFVYTLCKILFRRTGPTYESVAPDPQFRRRVFRDDSRTSPDKLVVTAISGLVAEVQQQMEASYAQNQQRQDVQDNHARPYTNGTILLNSGPVHIVASEYREPKENSLEPQKEKESLPEEKEPSPEPVPEPKESLLESQSSPEPKESNEEIVLKGQNRETESKEQSTELKSKESSENVELKEPSVEPELKESSEELEPKEQSVELDSNEVLQLKEPKVDLAPKKLSEDLKELTSQEESSPESKEPKQDEAHNREAKAPTRELKDPTPEREELSPGEESPEKSPESDEISPEESSPEAKDNEINDLVKLEVPKEKDTLVKATEDFLSNARILKTPEKDNSKEGKLSTPELLEEALKEDSPEEVVEEEEVEEEEEEEVEELPENASVKHKAEQVKSIFLETEIPQQSRVLVAEFAEKRADKTPPTKHSPMVVSGKMTLSLIQDAPRDTPERDPESTVDDFTTASGVTQPAAEKEELSEEELDEEIEIEEIEEEVEVEEEEEEEPPKKAAPKTEPKK